MCGSPTDQWSAWITNWKVGEDYQPWEMKDRSTQDGNSMEFPGLLNSGWSMFEQIYQPVFASCQKRNLLPKMVALGVPNQLSQPVSTQSAWKIMTNWSASGYGWIYLHHDNLQNFYGWISSSIWMNIYIYIPFSLKSPKHFRGPMRPWKPPRHQRPQRHQRPSSRLEAQRHLKEAVKPQESTWGGAIDGGGAAFCGCCFHGSKWMVYNGWKISVFMMWKNGWWLGEHPWMNT